MSAQINAKPRCLAVAITKVNDGGKRAHLKEQCTDSSVQKIDGIDLCWAHARALKNPHRSAALELVEP